MRHAHVVVVALVGLGACSEAPVSPQGTAPDVVSGPQLAAVVSTINDVADVDITSFVPCANGGAGELVHATGNLHELFTTIINANGAMTLKTQFQPQGLTGVGLTTGDTYQATGLTQETDQLREPFPVELTFVNNFRFIGHGPDNNLLIHETIHLTINANGVITKSGDKFTEDCR